MAGAVDHLTFRHLGKAGSTAIGEAGFDEAFAITTQAQLYARNQVASLAARIEGRGLREIHSPPGIAVEQEEFLARLVVARHEHRVGSLPASAASTWIGPSFSKRLGVTPSVTITLLAPSGVSMISLSRMDGMGAPGLLVRQHVFGMALGMEIDVATDHDSFDDAPGSKP